MSCIAADQDQRHRTEPAVSFVVSFVYVLKRFVAHHVGHPAEVTVPIDLQRTQPRRLGKRAGGPSAALGGTDRTAYLWVFRSACGQPKARDLVRRDNSAVIHSSTAALVHRCALVDQHFYLKHPQAYAQDALASPSHAGRTGSGVRTNRRSQGLVLVARMAFNCVLAALQRHQTLEVLVRLSLQPPPSK